MKTVLRNVLVFLVALVLGSFANMGLIIAGSALIPPPAGVDVRQAESLAANMHLFEARHFLFPFLAHAVGTLVGAVLVGWLAASQQRSLALGIGIVFLIGGILATFMIPAPWWFIAADLLLAYLPMAWLGGALAEKIRRPA